MLKWVNILHLHQPPHQDEAVVKKVAEESYSLILSLLARYPKLKLTINLSGSLIELLRTYHLENILTDIEKFVKEGRVELMASALYHPVLPLIPKEEVERQIDLFVEVFKAQFPTLPLPTGFFLPEMAYSKEVADIIVAKGFSWTVLDDLHAGREVDRTVRYEVKGLPLTVLFRNRKVSNYFPPQGIFEFLNFENEDITLITAHDGELYGHWHKDDKGFYEKAFTHPKVEFVLASPYIASLTKKEEIEPKEISWETTPEDEETGAPYSLWQHPENEIHDLMWHFTNFCLETVKKHPDDPHFKEARIKLDRGLTSCGWWWMSGRKIGPFSPVAWHPSETVKGLDELIESVRLLSTLPPDVAKEAEVQYENLVTYIFDTHAKIIQNQ